MFQKRVRPAGHAPKQHATTCTTKRARTTNILFSLFSRSQFLRHRKNHVVKPPQPLLSFIVITVIAIVIVSFSSSPVAFNSRLDSIHLLKIMKCKETSSAKSAKSSATASSLASRSLHSGSGSNVSNAESNNESFNKESFVREEESTASTTPATGTTTARRRRCRQQGQSAQVVFDEIAAQLRSWSSPSMLEEQQQQQQQQESTSTATTTNINASRSSSATRQQDGWSRLKEIVALLDSPSTTTDLDSPSITTDDSSMGLQTQPKNDGNVIQRGGSLPPPKASSGYATPAPKTRNVPDSVVAKTREDANSPLTPDGKKEASRSSDLVDSMKSPDDSMVASTKQLLAKAQLHADDKKALFKTILELQGTVKDHEATIASLGKELAQAQASIDKFLELKDKYDTRIGELNVSVTDLRTEKAALKEMIADLRNRNVVQLQESCIRLQADLEANKRMLEEAKK
jgi:hypothetical protein